MADDKEYHYVELDETVPQVRRNHMAVCVKNNILIFGGEDCDDVPFSCRVIWMFNMFTEQWSKHVIPESEAVRNYSVHGCAVAISDDVYVFGGFNVWSYSRTNALWTLKRTSETSYVWSEVPTMDNMKAPSPREYLSGWEYTGHLWVFAGYGLSPVGYLNDSGEFYHAISNHMHGWNNQLLSFDPSSQEWTNPKSTGAIPSPRLNYAVTTVGRNVWLHGGCGRGVVFDELYKLNMSSLIWTQIQTINPKPQVLSACTLTGTTETKLVLHGGCNLDIISNDTWILDIPSQTWRQYKSNTDHTRFSHTSTVIDNGWAVITGGQRQMGHSDSYKDYSFLFLIMLEPRSLQQLAMQMILKHRFELPWQHLPNKLIALLGISESDKRTIEKSQTSN